MARVVLFDELGGPEVLRVAEVEIGAPGAGEVRVRIEAIGLNRAEAMYRQGRYIDKPVFPSRMGYEGAGVVLAVGPDVTDYRAGDRVSIIPTFSMARYGVFAEEAILPAGSLTPIPDGMSFVDAAAVWMAFVTAYGAVIQNSVLKAGDAVLFTAGSSSVAMAGMQIAKREGLVAIASTRTSAKREALLAAGADHVIVTSEQDLPAEVRRITGGHGARLVFDPIGGPNLATLAEATAADGRLLVYGSFSSDPSPFELFPMVEGGRPLPSGGRIEFYTYQRVINDPARFGEAKAYIRSGLETGVFRSQVAKVFPFPSPVEAYAYQESNAQIGKIVVSVER